MKREETADLIEIEVLLNKARYHRNVSCKDKKAIKICEKILKIDPDNRDAMLIKAGALEALWRSDESRDLISSIIKKWPNHWEAYYLSARDRFFSEGEEEEGLELIDKSLELNENFDNIMTKAQMLYLMRKDCIEFIEKAKKIDKKRAENFMKNVWIYDINAIKPTLGELFHAFKALTKLKRK